jgi:hypothetical protein
VCLLEHRRISRIGGKRVIVKQILFHPLIVIAVSVASTLIFILLMSPLPRFAGEGRFYLTYYHAPIGFAFVTYLFDRVERWDKIRRRQWIVELPVLGLALARALMPIPFISGHALFSTYAVLTVESRIARWAAALVVVGVAYIKVLILQDTTLVGGMIVGMLAALLTKREHPCSSHRPPAKPAA